MNAIRVEKTVEADGELHLTELPCRRGDRVEAIVLIPEQSSGPRDNAKPEYQTFLRLLPELLATHQGKYVAVHGGQVVDSDTDEVKLILRVQAKIGYVPIHVGLVTAAQPVVRIPHYRELGPREKSMIRYRYADQFNPPAPFVNVALRCPTTGSRTVDLPAQVDPAADRTVLPGRVVEALGLVEDGRALFQGFAGEVIELPVFLIEVQVHDLPPLMTRAALGEKETHILLGRDVLNAHRIVLDGPKLALEIEQPTST